MSEETTKFTLSHAISGLYANIDDLGDQIDTILQLLGIEVHGPPASTQELAGSVLTRERVRVVEANTRFEILVARLERIVEELELL